MQNIETEPRSSWSKSPIIFDARAIPTPFIAKSSSTASDVTTSIPENQQKSMGVSGVGVIRLGWKF